MNGHRRTSEEGNIQVGHVDGDGRPPNQQDFLKRNSIQFNGIHLAKTLGIGEDQNKLKALSSRKSNQPCHACLPIAIY
jgi:hypothetical protein